MEKERRTFFDHVSAGAEVFRKCAVECEEAAIEAASSISSAFRSGGKLLLCGNGGSAADSQHWATEFTNRYGDIPDRPALPAIALTTDTSFLTAHANDFGFDSIFERQIEALGKSGDVLVAISTSGQSENVLRAVRAAERLEITTVALTGSRGVLAAECDIAIQVPSENTQHIQEAHIAIEHAICEIVESQLYRR